MARICVIGLGYIGLPTASMLAEKAHIVYGVDVNAAVVSDLNKGIVHIYEPDLDALVKKVVIKGKFIASEVPEHADIFLLSVPTPFTKEHKADLSYVQAAAQSIAPYIQAGNLVILESTSPVGTTEKIGEWISRVRTDLFYCDVHGNKNNIDGESEFFLAHCPERVLPGKILTEIVKNDRIIGGVNKKSAELAKSLYASFVEGEIVLTDSRTAEMSKLTENAFRDVNIAFANELSMICDSMGINVWELIRLANRHPRVNVLEPGPGVGGHCIAVDPWFIVDSAPDRAHLIKMARDVNDFKPQYVIEKVEAAIEKVNHPMIALLGLAFKADVDDLRESPSIKIAERLANKGYTLLAVEPYITVLPQNLAKYENITLCSLDDAVAQANIVVGLVNHERFYHIDRVLLQDKQLIDTKGIWEKV